MAVGIYSTGLGFQNGNSRVNEAAEKERMDVYFSAVRRAKMEILE